MSIFLKNVNIDVHNLHLVYKRVDTIDVHNMLFFFKKKKKLKQEIMIFFFNLFLYMFDFSPLQLISNYFLQDTTQAQQETAREARFSPPLCTLKQLSFEVIIITENSIFLPQKHIGLCVCNSLQVSNYFKSMLSLIPHTLQEEIPQG